MEFRFYFGMYFSLMIIYGCLPFISSQLSQTGLGLCDTASYYNYGVCRPNGCPQNEVYVPGRSYCDNFINFLYGNRSTRCATNSPCCAWGGVCRGLCFIGESSLPFPSDCSGGRSSCCLPITNRRLREEPCGTVNGLTPRIVGGFTGSPTDWPWVVRILHQGQVKGICAGVLLSADTFVTVAHCVQGFTRQQLRAVLGDFDLTLTDRGEEVVDIRSVEISPYFRQGRRGSDIAVLKLARNVQQSSTKRPICLPSATRTSLMPPDPVLAGAGVKVGGLLADQCFIAGWGVNEQGQVSQRLRTARVTLLNKRACEAVYRRTRPGANPLTLPDDIICTDTSVSDATACLFDDGAMLTCRGVDSRFVLVGIVTEHSCGRLPTLFTRIESFARALESRIRFANDEETSVSTLSGA